MARKDHTRLIDISPELMKRRAGWMKRTIKFKLRDSGTKKNPAKYGAILDTNSDFARYNGFINKGLRYAEQNIDNDADPTWLSNSEFDDILDVLLNEERGYTRRAPRRGANKKLIDKKAIRYAYAIVRGFRRYIVRGRPQGPLPDWKYGRSRYGGYRAGSLFKRGSMKLYKRAQFSSQTLNSPRELLETGALINSATATVYDSKDTEVMEVR